MFPTSEDIQAILAAPYAELAHWWGQKNPRSGWRNALIQDSTIVVLLGAVLLIFMPWPVGALLTGALLSVKIKNNLYTLVRLITGQTPS